MAIRGHHTVVLREMEMDRRIKTIGTLALEHCQKDGSTDCLKRACFVLSQDLPYPGCGNWHDAVIRLRAADVCISLICQKAFQSSYGTETNTEVVSDATEFAQAISRHPAILVAEAPKCALDQGEKDDHAIASSGTMTADTLTGCIEQYDLSVRIIVRRIKAAILFPRLNGKKCSERMMSLKGD